LTREGGARLQPARKSAMNGDGVQAPPVEDAGATPFVAVGARRGSLATAAVLAAAGLVLLSQAVLLDLGSLSLPGPGFVPVALSLATILLAGIIAVRDWQVDDDGATVGLGYRDVVIVFAAMLAVPPLFEPLGAYPTLGLFAAVLLVLVARTGVAVAVAAAAIGMVACWFFFGLALALQLPTGTILERIGL